jgi:hypothetical protein
MLTSLDLFCRFHNMARGSYASWVVHHGREMRHHGQAVLHFIADSFAGCSG